MVNTHSIDATAGVVHVLTNDTPRVSECQPYLSKTIDALWRYFSDGKFGFSVQRKIWIGQKRQWPKFFKVGLHNFNTEQAESSLSTA
jgi:hypothetical protein